ncbi:hypothetical protein DENIS_3480 [Desulfonema ishimotonii]|uniref:DUF2786 domain-containing protein n=1 Tax=Desulfonema ishimotonii TaxID=45657 RepID=A0A401FZW9_9BACT|nr:DUF2786 domain-containing protein [Desulfonema ishimotonii]GBC62508.1 hypothetical protein DENIS_3480 [Desulfonema ishimotonii]
MEVMDRLRKIRNLAETGTGGERQTAQALLDRLLKKHGVSPDDIDSDDAPKEYQYRYKTKLESKLLVQLYFFTTGKKALYVCRKTRTLYLDLSKSQKIFIDEYYSVLTPAMRKAFEELTEDFMWAFFAKNRLLLTSDEDCGNGKEISTQKRMRRICDLASGIIPTPKPVPKIERI